ncbi:transporter substrate-binding domain-containing protein [Micromonospora yasonensis]|uniref:transporter substrate-binding domain-containing protein n=1 Tax=Micromonospora yasonensis TaxID=1128667 RepID=UPI00222EDEE9|nr:transporter substrate-binding domain-containing protein [Micromonospora yasonensis]MCW3841008.1 transporter substrate-binding domain-containing protein [Micromonospora yasonensis]
MSQISEPGVESPEPVVTPRGVSRFRQLRLSALLVVLVVLAAAVVGVVTATGPPTLAELRSQAGLDGKQELLIGVKDDQPGVSQLMEDGSYRGFDIDIAYMIASDLGFKRRQVRFLSMESEDRARRQANDGKTFVTVDLVIASYSITQQRREQGVVFSEPYLTTEQSVLTLRGYPGRVDGLGDLRGRRVCTLATSTSEQRLRAYGAEASGKNRISECVQELYDGTVDAVTTDAAILAGFVAPPAPDARPKNPLHGVKPLRHWDIGEDLEEQWGVNTGPNRAMKELVDFSLYQAATRPGRDAWDAAFEANLAREQPANGPQQVAVGQQPQCRKVKVRQWPWESMVLVPSDPARRAARRAARARGRGSSGC